MSSTRRPPRLRRIILLPLTFFMLLFLLLTLLLAVSFRSTNALLEENILQRIPFAHRTMTLVQQSEQLRGLLFRYMQTDSLFVQASLLEQIQHLLRTGDEELKALAASALYAEEVRFLRQRLEKMYQIVERINALTTRKYELALLRTYQVKSFRVMAEDLRELSKRSTALHEWEHQGRDMLLSLLLLCQNTDISYGLQLKRLIRRQGEEETRLMRALAERDDLPEAIRARLRTLHHSLQQAAFGRNGVFSLFDQQDVLEQKYALLVIEVDALLESVSLSCNRLMDHADRTLTAVYREFDARLGQHAAGTLLGLLVVLCVSCLLYGYFIRRVITPIARIHSSLRRRQEDGEAEIPCDAGALEVREMAEALSLLIRTLERRERDLSESHASLERQVVQRTAELRHMSQRLLCAHEEERRRLAAELHDDVGATLGVMKLGIERALSTLSRKDRRDDAEAALKEVIALVKGMARQMRRIQNDLCPARLDAGLSESLEWFCGDFRLANPGIRLRTHILVPEADIPAPLRIVLFRIVQEALANIARHSGASHAHIVIDAPRDGLRIRVSDNGTGLPGGVPPVPPVPPPGGESGGRGIGNMRERVALSGGTFQITGRPGRGTRLEAYWPRAVLRELATTAPADGGTPRAGD